MRVTWDRLRCAWLGALTTMVIAASAMAVLSPISTASAAPVGAWEVRQASLPTILPMGVESNSNSGTGVNSNVYLRFDVINRGGATVPAGFTIAGEVGPGLEISQTLAPEYTPGIASNNFHPCSTAGPTFTCEVAQPAPPGWDNQVFVPVNVTAPTPGPVVSDITVSGGGVASVSSHLEASVGSSLPPFAFVPGRDGLYGGAFDERGEPATAGSHPFSVVLGVRLPAVGEPTYALPRPLDSLRSLEFELPSGFVLNPQATAVRCSGTRLEEESEARLCPTSSQVGEARVSVLPSLQEEAAIYNMVPRSGAPAELAFQIFGTTVYAKGGLSGGFRLTSASQEIISKYPVADLQVELWGKPSDSAHDRLRAGEGCSEGGCALADESPKPLLTMPTACGPLALAASATGWNGGRTRDERTFVDRLGTPVGVTGCQNLNFSPSLTIAPDSSRSSSPTGLHFELKLPQSEAIEGRASAALKDVTVRLPEGMSVNPPAADGLGACAPAQIGIGNDQPSSCPPAAKVGTAEIVTPLLQQPLKGSIYLAEQTNNPFRTLLALYVVLEGEGVVIKLPGRVDADPRTGQLTATFDENPQLPFETLKVRFNSGPRATLATPANCGRYNIQTELVSWSSTAPVVINSPFSIAEGCSGGFSPALEAGTTNPIAGSYSTFNLRVTRADGEQNISRISSTLPQGLLAKLAGVAPCPEQQAPSGDCPMSSQVGTTTVGVGTGPNPLYIPQAGKSPTAVYLAGAFGDAPYSLVVRVPAQAGPFDLGTIAVRVALNVDPFTAAVTASSNPLPQILEGIPVAYRDVRVDISRSQFIINPTSCKPMQITSTITSISGASANPASRFQVAGCESLAFKPSLKINLKGSTKRTGHPALKAVLTYPKEGTFSNIARAQVNLPQSEFLDQGNLNKTCTKPVLLSGDCPKSTAYGKAKAWTPLLDRPVEGPVYLVGGFGYKLPALVAELQGQIRILLAGKVDTGPNKGIRNTFEAVPDAPVSRFVLEMKGGKKYGLLENSENLCKRPQVGQARFTAQNGKVEELRTKIARDCAGGKKSGSTNG